MNAIRNLLDWRIRGLTALATLNVLLSCAAVSAQDTIEVKGGRPVRGKIIDSSASAVVIDVNGSQQTLSAGQVSRVRLKDSKGDLTRAINLFYDGNYNNVLEVLNTTSEKPATAIVQAEVDYCRAMSMAQEALVGGAVTVREAGISTREFLDNHADSFHVYQITRAFADLAWASGSIDVARTHYTKLLDIDWPEQVLECRFQLGILALIERDSATAREHFAAAAQVDTADKRAQELKIASRCRALQAQAEEDAASVIQALEEIIKNESSDQELVFANAYNALGHAYLSAGNTKAALLSFLRTQLLYSSRETAVLQAEALSELRRLWESMNEPERARQAQQTLAGSFGNTYYGNR